MAFLPLIVIDFLLPTCAIPTQCISKDNTALVFLRHLEAIIELRLGNALRDDGPILTQVKAMRPRLVSILLLALRRKKEGVTYLFLGCLVHPPWLPKSIELYLIRLGDRGVRCIQTGEVEGGGGLHGYTAFFCRPLAVRDESGG